MAWLSREKGINNSIHRLLYHWQNILVDLKGADKFLELLGGPIRDWIATGGLGFDRRWNSVVHLVKGTNDPVEGLEQGDDVWESLTGIGSRVYPKC